MKLKIVQPEIEKKEEEEIELYLEYSSYQDVYLCSRKNGHVCREILIDRSRDVCIIVDGPFVVDREMSSESNLRRVYS
jgi:hypothetical protein